MNETMLLAADAQAPITGDEDALQPDAGSSGLVETDVKTCPVCRARLFADMDTCFNCMYRFGSNPALEAKAAQRAQAQPLCGATGGSSSEEGSQPSEALDVVRPPKAPASGGCLPTQERAVAADERLLSELLVELHGFLGQFLLDRGIDAKQL